MACNWNTMDTPSVWPDLEWRRTLLFPFQICGKGMLTLHIVSIDGGRLCYFWLWDGWRTPSRSGCSRATRRCHAGCQQSHRFVGNWSYCTPTSCQGVTFRSFKGTFLGPIRDLDSKQVLIGGWNCRTNNKKLKVFNFVVLDDPRKTVYKKVNRGSLEIDPSQVYFGWNGGKIQIWFVANFFLQDILFCYCFNKF
jgi:hypothetical protein